MPFAVFDVCECVSVCVCVCVCDTRTMEQTQNRLASAKWSRNLNENVQSEANRLRLLEKQRQIMETKMQRRQNQPAGSGVFASRPATSVSGSRTRIPQPSTAEMSFDSTSEQSVLSDVSLKSHKTSEEASSINAAVQARARTSVPGQRRLASLDSPSSATSASSNSPLKSQHPPVINAQRSAFGTNQSKPNVRNMKNLNRSEGNIAAAVEKSETSLISPNPLETILSDEELLKFVSQPVPAEVTLQCTIIRDKKGLDRSFYPTYYMHLQEIISTSTVESKKNDDKSGTGDIQGTAIISMSDSVDSLESFNSNDDDENDKKPNSGSKASNASMKANKNRKVFVLSGRRRKKSKTYLIGNNAFDISRDRCIAKLKSNVLGTQFTTVKLNCNGMRVEITSITYETNVLGFKGPRKMSILIPKPDEKTNAIVNLSLQEEFKRHSSAVIQLKNKTPIWNEETQSYVLNFHGRVTQASVKNFQLVAVNNNARAHNNSSHPSNSKLAKSASTHHLNQGDHMDDIEDDDDSTDSDQDSDRGSDKARNPPPRILSKNLSKSGLLASETAAPEHESSDQDELVSLQFGRVSNTQFSCDVSWPFSLLQAFAIALSSFDSKLACE